jgi:hypothetical protein
VHALVQDRHDADIAVAEPPPVDEVVLLAEDTALDAEFRRIGREATRCLSIRPKASKRPVM